LDTPTKKKTIAPDEPRSLFSHLGELRSRITRSVVAIVFCSIGAYPAVDSIIQDFSRQVGKLYFTGPIEAFWARVKISLFLGVLISLPFVLYQTWAFLQKGLLPKEKRFVTSITLVSYALFLAGAALCYFYVLPVGVKFLLAYGSDVLVPLITISRYLSFAMSLVFAFGLIFELPIVVGFLVKAGILKAQTLQKQWRFAVVLIFIAAAALTPGPDVFSQVLMAGPLLVLYAVSIIVARIIEGRR
jgi:sec-independent protein translocase protein TatC